MTGTAPEVSPEQLTRVYVKIRDKRNEMSAAFKIEDNNLKTQQDQIKLALLAYCKEHGINTGNTDGGTFIRSIKTKYWTSDWDSMYEFVMEHNVPEFFQKSLNQTNVRDFLKDNPDITPKGLNVDSEYVISVRAPKKKED